jgi:hypothetical protein
MESGGIEVIKFDSMADRIIYSCHDLERETGLEPATSSLGSLHSTTELLPLVCSQR